MLFGDGAFSVAILTKSSGEDGRLLYPRSCLKVANAVVIVSGLSGLPDVIWFFKGSGSTMTFAFSKISCKVLTYYSDRRSLRASSLRVPSARFRDAPIFLKVSTTERAS